MPSLVAFRQNLVKQLEIAYMTERQTERQRDRQTDSTKNSSVSRDAQMNDSNQWSKVTTLTFSTPSSISVGSSPIEKMHLMMAEMMNASTDERRVTVIAAASDMNIDVQTIPDTRPSISVTHTHTHTHGTTLIHCQTRHWTPCRGLATLLRSRPPHVRDFLSATHCNSPITSPHPFWAQWA